MPAFGRDGMLKRDEIATVADYVRSHRGLPAEPGADLARRQEDLRRQLRRLSRRRTARAIASSARRT